MANYPVNTVTFGSPRVDLSSVVVAEDVNSLYREVVNIAADLGAGNMGVGTPGLRFSAAWGIGTFATTTTWTGLQARIQNIENGLHRTYFNSIDKQSRANFNTIQSVDANEIGLSIKRGAVGPVNVTYAVSDGTTVTYTATNRFTVGQKATVTGLSVSTGKTLNLSLQTITGLVGSGPEYTGFTIVAPSVTGVTGTASSGSTSLTVVGDVTDVVVGMTVSGTGIASGTKVSSVSGQVVTLDLATSAPVSGSITFRTIGTSSGTGSVTAFQTTLLQRWQQANGSEVASIDPDGDLYLAGNLDVSGNTDIDGDATVVGDVSIGGSLSVVGSVSISVINGGTP